MFRQGKRTTVRSSARMTGHAFVSMRWVAMGAVLCMLWLGDRQLSAQINGVGQPPALPGTFGNAAPMPGAANTAMNAQPASGTPQAAPASSEASPQIPVTSLFSAIRQGGVMMIPIIGCSFALMVFVFERMLFLRRSRVIPRSFVRGVIEQLEQGQLERDEAIELCEENGSPIAQLFQAALKRYGRQAVEIEQAVLDAGERVSNSLRSYLRLFNTISNVTPLLGLLGTVLGMIEAFNAIAQTGAMGKPELLAGGIGQALLTTAAGLFVAIPAYTAYAFFLARADKLIIEMDLHVQRVIELVSAEGLQESGRSRSRSRRAAA